VYVFCFLERFLCHVFVRLDVKNGPHNWSFPFKQVSVLGVHLFPNSLGKRMKRAAENSEAAKVLKSAHAAQNRGAASNLPKKKGSGRGGGGGGFRNGPSTSRQPDFRSAPSRNSSNGYVSLSFLLFTFHMSFALATAVDGIRVRRREADLPRGGIRDPTSKYASYF
jgi:hypothetical protein